MKGVYGNEKSDAHEGTPARSSKTWNLYMYTNAEGKVLFGYAANDPEIQHLDLPVRTTAPFPEYFAKPDHRALDAALAGEHHPYFDRLPWSAEFRFFMGQVLQHSVPGTVRTAFEEAVAALPDGPIAPAHADRLAQEFPNVANAYSAEQWAQTFAARGVDAEKLGAVF